MFDLSKKLFTIVVFVFSVTVVACGENAPTGTSSASAAPADAMSASVDATADAVIAPACLTEGAAQLTFTTDGVRGDIMAPHLTADGARILFVAARGAMGDTEGDPATLDLFSVNCDGTGLFRVTDFATQPPPAAVRSVSLSADGWYAAYESNMEIHVMNLSDLTETIVDVGVSPVISPDGSFVVYQASQGRVARASTDGAVIDYISPSVRLLPDIEGYHSLSVSGDGKRVAFTSNANINDTNPDRSWEIFVVDATGANLYQATNGDAHSLAVFPTLTQDGSHVVYHSNQDQLQTNLYRGFQVWCSESAGAYMEQLTSFGSRDNLLLAGVAGTGRAVTFTGTSEEVGGDVLLDEMLVIDPDGTVVATYNAPVGTIAGAPTLSADGKHMVVYSDADPFGTNADGSTEVFFVTFPQ